MTARMTSPQRKQVHRLVDDVLDTLNLDKGATQRLLGRGGEFKEKLERLVLEASVDDGETPSQRAARKIMGSNMLGLLEVEEHFGKLTAAQRLTLAEVPFDKAVLKACAQTHVLVADIGLSLVDVRDKASQGLFYSQSWYDDEEFANRADQACWRLIRKTPVENSTSKTWSEQQGLIADIDEVPSARQVVYTMILHYMTTGERLFEHVYVRTCDVVSDGYRVSVGYFDEYGLFVDVWYDDFRHSYVGVAVARKS